MIEFTNVQYFVLDEADVMMDKGFYFEVIGIGRMCNVRILNVTLRLERNFES